MRIVISIISILVFFTACQKGAAFSLSQENKNKIIALQPFGNYDQEQLLMLKERLSYTFQIQVLILNDISIPNAFRVGNEGYVADSIIQFLLQFKNDSIVQVVGLTHEKISTLRESRPPKGIKGEIMPYWHKVRGMGYIGENACIISDDKLMTTDQTLWHRRVWLSVLHEIGHNLGLEHCKVESCLMANSKEDTELFGKSGRDFCNNCWQKVK